MMSLPSLRTLAVCIACMSAAACSRSNDSAPDTPVEPEAAMEPEAPEPDAPEPEAPEPAPQPEAPEPEAPEPAPQPEAPEPEAPEPDAPEPEAPEPEAPEPEAPEPDAPEPEAPEPEAPEPEWRAPCEIDERSVQCEYGTRSLNDGTGERDVHFALPLGRAPDGGWPVAILFQGSFFSGEGFMSGEITDRGPGAYYQAQIAAHLLAAGFAVIAPEARGGGRLFWDTNLPRWADNWEASPDHRLMTEIFAIIDGGRLGVLNPRALYAAGISSGGYMSSRMAVSYPGRFRALGVHSASYATCSGERCEVPDPLPADHPPTLLMHGEADDIVPAHTSAAYHDALQRDQIESERIVLPGEHSWFESSAREITDWFSAH